MNGRLSDIVEGFAGKSVLVIGDLMLDSYVEGEVTRISQEAPVPILKTANTTYSPGGAGNTAKNIRMLGGKVILAGAIGDDDEGKVLSRCLNDMDIDCSCVITDKTRPTTKKTRFISMKHQLLRVDRESTEPLSETIAREMVQRILTKIQKADAIAISDYAKGLLGMKTISSIMRMAKDYGKPVVVDTKLRNFRYYSHTMIIKSNFREAQEITQSLGSNEDGFVEAMGVKLRKMSGTNILITRGDKGMSLFGTDARVTHIPSRRVEISDVSGAGDTVTAVMALAAASGLDLLTAAKLSNKAASIKVTKFGTAAILPNELKSLLREEITKSLTDSIRIKQEVIENQSGIIEKIANKIIQTYSNHKKILVFGNGGSASDAQHLTGELMGRFKIERKGFAAISLPADSTTLTAIGNDYGFDHVFEREIETLGSLGDLAIAFSTGGNSKNIIRGLQKAREIGMGTIVMTGKDGGAAKLISDLCIIVPSQDTSKIQETHIAIIHIICEILENHMYPGPGDKKQEI